MPSQKVSNPGQANSSPWNDSGFAFPPNTNVMDSNSMPSDQAQLAREKSNQIMAALKAGDTAKANALMWKDETPGRLLPGMGWIKKKVNSRKGSSAALEGEAPSGGDEAEAGSVDVKFKSGK